jgi:hypothetical protein
MSAPALNARPAPAMTSERTESSAAMSSSAACSACTVAVPIAFS